MNHIVGIDFGTSNTSISFIYNGEIKNFKYNNLSLIPSRISFNDDKFKCGINCLKNNKLENFKMNILNENFEKFGYNINQILIIFFTYLYNLIKKYLGDKDIEIIASVPSNFNDISRNMIKNCFIKSGFIVNRLINEPTAAALSFGLENFIDDAKIMVLDIGGGTTDISIMEVDDTFFETVDSYGLNIGGKDLNKYIYDYIINDLKYDYSSEKIEIIKKRINILDYYQDDNIKISLNEFKDLISDVLIKYDNIFNEIKKNHKIDKIIMVGGGSNMKIIHELIERNFGNIILENHDYNHIVSKGCCYYLGYLKKILKKSDQITLVDTTPLSLGIELSNGNFSPIISKNTAIPTSNTQRYVLDNNLNDNKELNIKIYQGERKIAKDNICVGSINYIIKSKSVNHTFSITFKLTLDNIINISILDEINNQKENYILQNKFNYDYIDENIKNSTKYYMDDLKNFKINEKKSYLTILIENKINNINHNISIDIDKKNKLLEELFKILQNIDEYSIEELEKYIENNKILFNPSNENNVKSIDKDIINEMIKNRIDKINDIINKILSYDDVTENELMYIEYATENIQTSNITTIILDNVINDYEFVKRIDYYEEYYYLILYLRNNISTFDIENEKKNKILDFINDCDEKVKLNKEYKKYINLINDFCSNIKQK